jgi:hypothetical protein
VRERVNYISDIFLPASVQGPYRLGSPVGDLRC